MSAGVRAAAALLGLSLGILAPHAAHAQGSAPQISAQISARKVEVGEPFTIQIKASGEQIAPNSPTLQLPAGFAMAGQSIAQFGTRFRRGIDVTWTIIPQKVGRFAIPGPSITVNQNRLSAAPLAIEVVKASPGSASQHPSPSNPFLLPGGPSIRIPGGFFPGFDEPDEELDPRDEPTLSSPTAPDSQVFLRAIPDKKSAVIGEQITLSVYIYFRDGIDLRAEESHDAPLADFRRVSLLSNPGAEPELRARAGGEAFRVRLLDRIGLFPLRVGELHTGSFRRKLTSRRLGSFSERASEDLIITVTEPPTEHRPAGYVFGDVGQFSLAATVVPHTIEQGGAVAVNIKVSGSGNFPQQLHLPERTGLEWLDPEKKEQLGIQNGIVTGSRSFGYVVRIKDAGQINLGNIELSYWNPSAKRYEQARAALGIVGVTPAAPGPRIKDPSGKDPDPSELPESDPLSSLAPPRMLLSAFSAPRAPLWGEGGALWFLIAAPPLLVGLGFAGSSAARLSRTRRAAVKESPSALATKALREAEEASSKGDAKEVAAALERALHFAIESATGLKSRGVLLADLPAELEALDLEPSLAEEIVGAFTTCETIRFDPLGDAAARDLLVQARKAMRALERHKPT